eukprot:422878_1
MGHKLFKSSVRFWLVVIFNIFVHKYISSGMAPKRSGRRKQRSGPNKQRRKKKPAKKKPAKKKLKKRTEQVKQNDIRKARRLGDLEVQFYGGKRVKATVVPDRTGRLAVRNARALFSLGQSNKSKRHRIYTCLFIIYAKRGQNYIHHWDFRTYKKINEMYPDP